MARRTTRGSVPLGAAILALSLLALSLLALSLLAQGCAAVMPYERERLSHEDMEFEGDADLASSEDHATEVREGTAGGFGGGGGGCGCN